MGKRMLAVAQRLWPHANYVPVNEAKLVFLARSKSRACQSEILLKP